MHYLPLGIMGCMIECWDIGPPPDTILFLPPPPVPSFLQQDLPDLLVNTTPCFSTQLCESLLPVHKNDESDYIEMPRKGMTQPKEYENSKYSAFACSRYRDMVCIQHWRHLAFSSSCLLNWSFTSWSAVGDVPTKVQRVSRVSVKLVLISD